MTLQSAFGQIYGAFTVVDDEAVGSAQFPTGADNPSVQLSPVTGQLRMALDTPITPLPAACPEAAVIRFATALSEYDPWTPGIGRIGRSPSRPCGARAPAMVLGLDGDMAMVFEALDNSGLPRAGVAYLDAGVAPYFVANVPMLDWLTDMTLVRLDGLWYVWGVNADPLSGDYGDVMYSTSTDMVIWTAPAFTLDPGSIVAAQDGLSGQSMSCIDNTNFAWDSWIQGLNGGDATFQWLVGHLSDDVGMTYIFYSYFDMESGVKVIGWASLDPANMVDMSQLHLRDCVPPP